MIISTKRIGSIPRPRQLIEAIATSRDEPAGASRGTRVAAQLRLASFKRRRRAANRASFKSRSTPIQDRPI